MAKYSKKYPNLPNNGEVKSKSTKSQSMNFHNACQDSCCILFKMDCRCRHNIQHHKDYYIDFLKKNKLRTRRFLFFGLVVSDRVLPEDKLSLGVAVKIARTFAFCLTPEESDDI